MNSIPASVYMASWLRRNHFIRKPMGSSGFHAGALIFS